MKRDSTFWDSLSHFFRLPGILGTQFKDQIPVTLNSSLNCTREYYQGAEALFIRVVWCRILKLQIENERVKRFKGWIYRGRNDGFGHNGS